MTTERGIITFSHLRWDFVFQRPQHLMTQLAPWRRVVFIEEPWHSPDREPHWERATPQPGVTVYRLHTPNPEPGFHDTHLPTFEVMLPELLEREQLSDYVAWLYTPLAQPLLQELAPSMVVYDCMDELSAFANAPRELLEREGRLLEQADLVFTGGPSLYRAKQGRHPSVHCFPSSVDAAHFRRAQADLAEPADQADLPHPRLGFYGVIDERFDTELLAAAAQARPSWQFVIVGPVVKIDAATLPRNPNIRYIGQRGYADLPAYLAGWDVCLLPFARNEATRYISPTKTLEYMAAELPIVSTPIADVAEPYGEIVYLGDTPDAFIAACEQALTASPAERDRRMARAQAVLERTSWAATAQAMRREIEQAQAARQAHAARR